MLSEFAFTCAFPRSGSVLFLICTSHALDILPTAESFLVEIFVMGTYDYGIAGHASIVYEALVLALMYLEFTDKRAGFAL